MPIPTAAILAGIGTAAQLGLAEAGESMERRRHRSRIGALEANQRTGQFFTPEQQQVLGQGQRQIAGMAAQGQRRAEQLASAAGAQGSSAATLNQIRRDGRAEAGRALLQDLDQRQRLAVEEMGRQRQELEARQAAVSESRTRSLYNWGTAIDKIAESEGERLGQVISGASKRRKKQGEGETSGAPQLADYYARRPGSAAPEPVSQLGSARFGAPGEFDDVPEFAPMVRR